jgi:hypothetical protein
LHFSWKRFSNLKHHVVWQYISGEEHANTIRSYIPNLNIL